MISLVIKKDNSALHEQAYFFILYPHSYLIFLQQLKKKIFKWQNKNDEQNTCNW